MAGLIFMALPFAQWFHPQVHTSQTIFMVLGMAGVMFALVVGNLGAAGLLVFSAAWVLVLRAQIQFGHGGPLAYGAAFVAHLNLTAGVAVLALTPLIFRGRGDLLAGLLRVMVVLWLLWWAVELAGWDPLLTINPKYPMPAGLRGNCLGSSIILAGLLGAAWPLFTRQGWYYFLPFIALCLYWQDSTTGYLAAGASLCALWLNVEAKANIWFKVWRRLHAPAWGIPIVLILVAVATAWLLNRGPGSSERLTVWLAALKGSNLLGHGPGSWRLTMAPVVKVASPNSGFILALWEYGWLGLGIIALGIAQLLRQAWGNPRLFAALAGVIMASAGTLIWEQPVAVAWCLLLFGLVAIKDKADER